MLSATAVAWAATLALPYLLVIRRATSDAFLTTYFSDRFLVPWRPDAFAALWGVWHDVSAEGFLGHDALAGSPGAIAVVLSMVILAVCGVGLWEIWRRRGASGVLLMTGRWLEQRTCEPNGARRARACQMLGAYSSVMYTEAAGFSGASGTSRICASQRTRNGWP